MTTRRRRTASETGCEELSGSTASILSPSSTLPVIQFAPQIGTDWSLNAEAAAVYKKTDVVTLPTNNSAIVYTQYETSHLNSASHQRDFRNSNQKQTAFESRKTDISSASFRPWSVKPKEEIENMASRDRTQEFSRIIRSQQGNLVNGAFPYREGKKPKDLRKYMDFMQRSKLIGRNISSTYAKLEKLTHLAKKRSLFDDSQDHEIQELTGIIRHDLNSLTKQLEDLQNRSKMAGSTLNGTSNHLQKHSANLVGSLQTKVASITQKFKDVLEIRTENLKKQAERREQFAGGLVSGELPPQAVVGHHQGSVLLADEAAATSATRIRPTGASQGDFSIHIGSSDHTENDGTLEGAVGGTVYQQQLELMEEQDAYLQSRADTMKTIESTIVELGQMFTQLATMVKEQEEIVHRIDSNVDDAELNVEAAHTELLKYFKSVSSNRWLMVKVFGILIFFFVIFIVFMA